jgi:hypothetical protein
MARSLDEIKADKAAVDAKLVDWRKRVQAADGDSAKQDAIRAERGPLLEQQANYRKEAAAITNNPTTDKYAGVDANSGNPKYINSEGEFYTSTKTEPSAEQKAEYNKINADSVPKTQPPVEEKKYPEVLPETKPAETPAAEGSLAGNSDYNTTVNDGPAQETAADNQGMVNEDVMLQENEENIDPSNARINNAGLNRGGTNSTKTWNSEPTIISGVRSTAGVPTDEDWRVRISLPPRSSLFYKENSSFMMGPIANSEIDGIVFPYTPAITVSHNARYQEQGLTHSNYKSYFYEGSDVSAITISGEFTAQNQREGEYVLSVVYFLRACTRMFFGQETNAGQPPTIVFLDGYGDYYFPHVSCVVTNFTHTMPNDVDYIPLVGTFAGTRVPTMSTLSVTLQPVYSRKRIHESYGTSNYAQGDLSAIQLGTKKGPGGFL